MTVLVGDVIVTHWTRAAFQAQLSADLARQDAGQLYVGLYSALLRESARQAGYAEAIHRADVVYPDGAGVVMALRMLGCTDAERLATTDMMPLLGATAAAAGVSFVLVGGAPGVAERAGRLLTTQGLDVSATYDGYEHVASGKAADALLAASEKRLVLVGLGAARQERFALRLLGLGAKHTFLTCGGLFDHVNGTTRRAPDRVQQLGLEWAWRTAQEPRRLAGRYLLGNAYFLRAVLPQVLRHRTDSQL